VLFVCTGNVCRSAAAETLLRQHIHDGGAGQVLSVASAGVGSADGWRMDVSIADLLDKRGCSGMSGFRSRSLTDSIVEGADLVLTGTRDHRLRIGKDWPDAYARTFTLRECAWLLEQMPPSVLAALPTKEAERARAVLSWLQEERGLVSTPEGELDIADPMGGRAGMYRRMVTEVAIAVDVVARVMLPPAADNAVSRAPAER
jgi:protein-tyrosine phosphatase